MPPLEATRPHMRIRPIQITADDGHRLAGTWFRPKGPSKGHVVIAPAMATPAHFYRQFAGWLTEQDLTVLTFDYRGTTSTPAELRRENADLLTWARDAAAALEHAVDDAAASGGRSKVTWIGHSFGGQILPFVRHDLLDRAILVATGNGHFHHNPPWLRRRAPLLWRAIVPLTTAVAGYFPGRRLGILGDLPSGVARQWGRWCMHPGYWAADVPDIEARHATITHPVALLWMTDDALVTRSGPATLAKALTSAPVTLQQIKPVEHGVTSIGHHGLFRPQLFTAWETIFRPLLPPTSMDGITK